jgi:hypothetical protein
MNDLSLADLFLVGLVLDISGAILLARGLLLSPRELSRLNTFWGVGYGQHEDRIRNRVSGEFGVTYLVAGFLLQAAGYSFAISGVETKTGGDRLLVALAMAAVVAGLAWAGWWQFRERRVRALRALTEAIANESEAAGAEIRAKEREQEMSDVPSDPEA